MEKRMSNFLLGDMPTEFQNKLVDVTTIDKNHNSYGFLSVHTNIDFQTDLTPSSLVTHKERYEFYNDRFISLNNVISMTSLGKTTIYDLIKTNSFPKQIKVGNKKSCWSELEVREWMQRQKDSRRCLTTSKNA